MTDNTKSKARKTKTSKIPTDYDPTPDPHPVPKGKQRPDQESHVPSYLVSELDLDHPLLTANISKMGSLNRKLRFLIGKIVLVKGEYWIKDKKSGHWRTRSVREVKNCLKQDWGYELTDYNICDGTIDDLFANNQIPVLDSTICVPGGSDFLLFDGKKCLNIGSDPQLSFDTNAVKSEGFQVLMELIDQNLLANEPRSLAGIIDDIEDSTPNLTKWFFHWLASIYLRPGKQLSTNMWIVGSQQGIGKTQFTNLFGRLLGEGNAQAINLGELKSDWSDFLEGTQLAMADEVKLDSKRDFNDMLKRWIGNPVISLRRRNQGSFKVPNITNWIFTTNSMRPVVIEASDRRNTFIHTTEDQAARKLATRFYKLSDIEKHNAAEGLAALLYTIKIDDQLINTAYDTDLKQAILSLSEKPVLTWLKSGDVDGYWPVGTYMQNETIIQLFQKWANGLKVNHYECEPKIITQQLEELQNAGWVKFRRPFRSNDPHREPWKMRGFERTMDSDGNIYPTAKEVELAPYEKKSHKLKKFQAQQQNWQCA